MAERSLSGSIELTKYKSVILTQKGQSGPVRGVFIPLEVNHLEEKDGRIFSPIRLVVRDEQDKYGQNGFISKGIPKEVYQAHKEDKDKLRELQPIIGNVKDWSSGTAAASEPVQEFGSDEDLPF